ncbi:protein TOPLESS-like isoform X1 [Prunus yedoensis var. nudiflora]|uniref:Protein TOPLESS-like isoform X1 n=1 Tax=Prunus yedoensis var. nudiflora TaxID=2094558 RepID=A0A315B178_PRUYE|nr:protein TOPLESS-like isoform X1 [Prunus yedoensis var. nudiflora]
MSMRKTMMKELRQIIEANPVFRGKLKYPSIKSLRLHNLINQSLNWWHKDPRPNPIIKTLFVDHVCEPQENFPLPLPVENNLEDCLSLSLSTGNCLQMRSLREQYLLMLQRAQIDAHLGSVNDLAFFSPHDQLLVITCAADDKTVKWMAGSKYGYMACTAIAIFYFLIDISG